MEIGKWTKNGQFELSVYIDWINKWEQSDIFVDFNIKLMHSNLGDSFMEMAQAKQTNKKSSNITSVFIVFARTLHTFA